MIANGSSTSELGSPVRMHSSSDNQSHSQEADRNSSESPTSDLCQSDREKAYLAMSRPFPHRLTPQQQRVASGSSPSSGSSPRSLLQRRQESKGLITQENILSLPMFKDPAVGRATKKATQPQYDRQPVRRPGQPFLKTLAKGLEQRRNGKSPPAPMDTRSRPIQNETGAERVILCPYQSCSFGYRRSEMYEMHRHLSQVHGSRRCLWCEDSLQDNSVDSDDNHGKADVTQHLREQHRHQLLESFGLADCKACVFDGRDYLMVPLDAPAKLLTQPERDASDEKIQTTTRGREPVTPEKQVNQLRSPPLTDVKQKRGRRNSVETSRKRQRTEDAAVTIDAKADGFVPDEDMYCSRCLRKVPRIVDRTPGRSDLGRDVELAFHTDPKRSCRIPNIPGDAADLPNRSGWVRTKDLPVSISQIKADFLEKHPEYEATIYPQKVRSTLWKYDPNNQLNREAWGLPWPPGAAGTDKKRKRDAVGEDADMEGDDERSEAQPETNSTTKSGLGISHPGSSGSRFIKSRYLKPAQASLDPTYRPGADSETSSDSEIGILRVDDIVESAPQRQEQQQHTPKRRRVAAVDGTYRPPRDSPTSSESEDHFEVIKTDPIKPRTTTKTTSTNAVQHADSPRTPIRGVDEGNTSEDSNSSPPPLSHPGVVHVKAGLDPAKDPVLLGEARMMKKQRTEHAQTGKRDVELGVSRAPFGS